MIKLITLALCAVLVISCVEQVYGGVQHVKSELGKDEKAPTPSTKASSSTTKVPTVSTKTPSSTTKVPTVSTKTPSSTTKVPTVSTKTPSSTTKTPIPTTKAPTNATTAKPTPPHCQPGDKKIVEHSCKDYLECDSQFKWANKTCSTLCKVFEPKSAKCVWNWQYPCMKPPTTVAPPPSPTDNPTKGSTDAPTDAPTKAPATPTTNTPECKEGSVKPVKGNCKDYLTCKSNKWVETSCSFGYDFDINKHTCTWSWWAKC